MHTILPSAGGLMRRRILCARAVCAVLRFWTIGGICCSAISLCISHHRLHSFAAAIYILPSIGTTNISFSPEASHSHRKKYAH